MAYTYQLKRLKIRLQFWNLLGFSNQAKHRKFCEMWHRNRTRKRPFCELRADRWCNLSIWKFKKVFVDVKLCKKAITEVYFRTILLNVVAIMLILPKLRSYLHARFQSPIWQNGACTIKLFAFLMEQHTFKNVNNCLNNNIYSYLETSGSQSSNPHLNAVHFFNTRVK